MKTDGEAEAAIAGLNGQEVLGRVLTVEYQSFRQITYTYDLIGLVSPISKR